MAAVQSIALLLLSLTAAAIGAKNFTAVLEHCATLPLTVGNQVHSFNFPGYCYTFDCKVRKEHEDYHTGELQPKGCPDIIVSAPCTIELGDQAKNYPGCCPRPKCPGQNLGGFYTGEKGAANYS